VFCALGLYGPWKLQCSIAVFASWEQLTQLSVPPGHMHLGVVLSLAVVLAAALSQYVAEILGGVAIVE